MDTSGAACPAVHLKHESQGSSNFLSLCLFERWCLRIFHSDHATRIHTAKNFAAGPTQNELQPFRMGGEPKPADPAAPAALPEQTSVERRILNHFGAQRSAAKRVAFGPSFGMT